MGLVGLMGLMGLRETGLGFGVEGFPFCPWSTETKSSTKPGHHIDQTHEGQGC